MAQTDPCIFCKIASKQIPAKIIYEDESALAFHDINPQAPLHVLVIPRKHFASAQEADAADEKLLGHLHMVAAQIARDHNAAHGYRVVMNTGPDAGQTVFHVHLHLLAGRPFSWPPG